MTDTVAVGTLVGKTVPDFTAQAVMPDNSINEAFNLKEYLGGSYGWVFFYPLDFTFVCPSEIIAHHNRLDDFSEKDVKVVSISVDSQFSHLARKKPRQTKGDWGMCSFRLYLTLTSLSRAPSVF